MITLLYCAASICVFAAIHTFRLTVGQRDSWFHGWYTSMCLFGCLYLAGTIMHYQANAIAGAALGLRVQNLGAMGYVVSLCWFVYKLTNIPFGAKPLIAYTVAVFASTVYAYTFEFSFRFVDLDRTQLATLPWGEVVEYRMGEPNPLFFWYHFLEQFGCAWTAFCALFIRQKEDQHLRILLVVYSVLQSMALFSGGMIGNDQLQFIYTDWLPPVLLFVAMSFYFAGEQLKLSERLTQEIAERKSIEKLQKESALFDDLTGLPNHQALVARLEKLATVNDDTERYLFFIGIRDFKSMNLTYGSDNADLLLIELARRLKKARTGNMLAAREGGDCFAMIIEGRPGNDRSIEQQFREAQWSDLADLRKPFIIGEQEIFLTYSTGVVQLHHTASAQQALLMAGLAMNESRVRKSVVYYDRELTEEVSRMHSREIDLVAALSKQQLSLYMQPQISADGEMHGVEVLSRWQHSSQGFIAPDIFIPMAERLGLIGNLGWWVLRATCEKMAEWDKQNFQLPGRVAINVSTLQLKDPNFAKDFLTVIAIYEIKAIRLEIEVTESATLGEEINAKEQLDKLYKAGVSIAIDDFGTGYSSLSYFNALPISLLKIDRSFVRDMDSLNGTRLIQTIVNMARALGVQVLAEGVETEHQREQLQQMGCDAFQGFLWSPAVPAEELQDWVGTFNEIETRQLESLRTL